MRDEYIQQLASSDIQTRIKAVRALGSCGDAAAVAVLQGVIADDADEQVRRYARSALVQLQKDLEKAERTARQPHIAPYSSTYTNGNGNGASAYSSYGTSTSPQAPPIEAATWSLALRDLALYTLVCTVGPLVLILMGLSGLRYLVRNTIAIPEVLEILTLSNGTLSQIAIGIGLLTSISMVVHMLVIHGIAGWMKGNATLPTSIHAVVPVLTQVQGINFVQIGVVSVILSIAISSGALAIAQPVATISGIISLVVNIGGALMAALMVGHVYGIGTLKGIVTYIISGIAMTVFFAVGAVIVGVFVV